MVRTVLLCIVESLVYPADSAVLLMCEVSFAYVHVYADMGGDLKELCDALNRAVLPGKKDIFGFLRKRKNKASEAINNYECANERIKQIENNLRQHQKLLMKDIQIFEQM